MPDLLVKLFDLSHPSDLLSEQQRHGITIRKPIGPEKQLVEDWVRHHFGSGWASEISMAMTNRPISCFIAIKDKTLIGFACYDATALGYFGPIGIADTHKGSGTGTTLLLSCLADMRAKGYGYAIIGWAGPVDFYKKALGAIEIPDSGDPPGLYRDLLVYDDQERP